MNRLTNLATSFPSPADAPRPSPPSPPAGPTVKKGTHKIGVLSQKIAAIGLGAFSQAQDMGRVIEGARSPGRGVSGCGKTAVPRYPRSKANQTNAKCERASRRDARSG